MLRPLYRCVLRLHPPAFRTRFAEEMISIFDHATGQRAALTLLADGLVSLARQWTLRPEFWHDIPAEPVPEPAADGIPSFYTIDPFRPRTAFIIHGLVLSTAIFCLTCFAIRYSWIHILHVHFREVAWDSPRSTPRSASPATNAPLQTAAASAHLADESPVAPSPASPSSFNTQFNTKSRSVPAIQNLPAQSPAVHGTEARVSETRATGTPGSRSQPQPQAESRPQSQSSSNANLQQRSRPSPDVLRAPPVPPAPSQSQTTAPAYQPQAQLKSQAATTADMPPAAAEDMKVDAAERRRVIDGAIANLKAHYVDPDVARRTSDALLAHERSGDDNTATDGTAFADLLTRQMMVVSHDKYLVMEYSAATAPENPPEPTSDEAARYRKEMEENRCTIEAARILPHEIGYLKFNAFPDASICGTTVAAAMASLNHADAIIFDLRDNRGGYSNMVALIATYLFDRPTHLNDFYNRSDNSTEQSWTLPPVPGNRLADKPVFVLISPVTFSAAEGFSYDLKMLHRATLVGETTSGRGHMGMGHRIDERFTIRVPGVRVVNPISKTNWEGTGVAPDVKVNAADALQTARKLAEKALQNK
jgi:hypothetical protein